MILNKETGQLERGEAVPAPASVFSSMHRSREDPGVRELLADKDLPITMPVLPRPPSRDKLCYFKTVKHMQLGKKHKNIFFQNFGRKLPRPR